MRSSQWRDLSTLFAYLGLLTVVELSIFKPSLFQNVNSNTASALGVAVYAKSLFGRVKRTVVQLYEAGDGRSELSQHCCSTCSQTIFFLIKLYESKNSFQQGLLMSKAIALLLKNYLLYSQFDNQQ